MKVGHLGISQHSLKPLPGIFQPLLVSTSLKDPVILFIGVKVGEQLEARLAHGHFSVAAVLGLVQEYLSALKINLTPFQAELFALPHPSVEGHNERRQLGWTILKDRIHHPFLFVVLQPAHAGVVLAPCSDQPGCVALQATRDHRQLKRPAKGGLVAVLGGSGPVRMTRDQMCIRDSVNTLAPSTTPPAQ